MDSKTSVASRVEGISIRYVDEKYLDNIKSGNVDGSVLSVVSFGRVIPENGNDFLSICLPIPQLGPKPLYEVWGSNKPVTRKKQGNIRYATTEDYLFGHITCPQNEGESFDQVSQRLYESILSLLPEAGYEHLYRMWNYFPHINETEGEMERYKLFCVGRANGFDTVFGDAAIRHYPSASAVGTGDVNVLSVHFIAGKSKGSHIENPRQVSAYRYPLRYGPRSPSFARATVTDIDRQRLLYVAGTASITDSESRHIGDLDAQFHETMRNIEALRHTAFGRSDPEAVDADDGLYKIYLRDPGDYDRVNKLFIEKTKGSATAIFLAGNICRKELLLEIELIANDPVG